MKRISGVCGVFVGAVFVFMSSLITVQAMLLNETADFWVGFFMSLLAIHYTANSLMLSFPDE